MGSRYCSLVLHCCTLRLKWTSMALQICEVCECLVFLLPPCSLCFCVIPFILHALPGTWLGRKFSGDRMRFYSYAVFMCVKATTQARRDIGSHCQQVCSCVVLSVLRCFVFVNAICHQQSVAKSKLSAKVDVSCCDCGGTHLSCRAVCHKDTTYARACPIR